MRFTHLDSTRGRHRHTGFHVLVNPVAQTPDRNIQQFSRTRSIPIAVSKRAQDVSALDLSQSCTDFHVVHFQHLFNAAPPPRALHRVMVNHWLIPGGPRERVAGAVSGCRPDGIGVPQMRPQRCDGPPIAVRACGTGVSVRESAEARLARVRSMWVRKSKNSSELRIGTMAAARAIFSKSVWSFCS